jgi:1-deoxy-D-xylulose-5-phosphate synthase
MYIVKDGADDYPLLSQIDSPADIRGFDEQQLIALTDEVRQFLLSSVSQSGGHLAAGLGTVELTVALHYVFNTPDDRIIWDVGHQAYPHKILTGRKHQLRSIRTTGGLSPFPKRSENPHDAFGVGHSSTSIGAALGMATAAAVKGTDQQMIAVIGDGGITGGMAFEALNHAGTLDANLLVILNDNEMSISPNVGALSRYLAKLLSSKFYTTVREESKKVLTSHVPSVWKLARLTEEHVKGMVVPGTLFEELGFNYIGPIDGHDLPDLLDTFKNIRHQSGPRFLHIVTKKGKGYQPAEDDPVAYHGVGSFDPELDHLPKSKPSKPTYTKVFGDWLCDMAAKDERLLAITPAMREGSGLVEFEKQFPDRYFDVAIAEQHALTLAAGQACEGLKPVVAIYSTFLQRGYDQLIHDIALQKLPVLLAIDRAGLVGPDGPTHAGSFDLSYLRCIPNMVVMAPADENECRQMLFTGFQYDDGPSAVRYPRGQGPGVEIEKAMTVIPIGQAEIRHHGEKVAILAFGSMVTIAEQVAEIINATVVNMRFVKPLDQQKILQMAETHDVLITIEENVIQGGAGSGINEILATHKVMIPVLNLGLPDQYIEHGSREDCLAMAGLDVDTVRSQIEQFSKVKQAVQVQA